MNVGRESVDDLAMSLIFSALSTVGAIVSTMAIVVLLIHINVNIYPSTGMVHASHISHTLSTTIHRLSTDRTPLE